MNKTYYAKRRPCIEIEDYRCKILNWRVTPISLRYPDVNLMTMPRTADW